MEDIFISKIYDILILKTMTCMTTNSVYVIIRMECIIFNRCNMKTPKNFMGKPILYIINEQ